MFHIKTHSVVTGLSSRDQLCVPARAQTHCGNTAVHTQHVTLSILVLRVARRMIQGIQSPVITFQHVRLTQQCN
jgi:hypothetical protein